ncbi:hypothetical protein RRG08_005645 [Elysia crispata]|uniref:Uncharacterized protein n=1 Tax=Elysia crispata TaxID=231223 RepID=A0AAE1EBV6_9GAST|nr:hypothetical protein RRG08_005645 [Elysia crispata]
MQIANWPLYSQSPSNSRTWPGHCSGAGILSDSATGVAHGFPVTRAKSDDHFHYIYKKIHKDVRSIACTTSAHWTSFWNLQRWHAIEAGFPSSNCTCSFANGQATTMCFPMSLKVSSNKSMNSDMEPLSPPDLSYECLSSPILTTSPPYNSLQPPL